MTDYNMQYEIDKDLDKEFNLSEKSWKVCSDPSNPKYDLDVIKTEDVKESIKRLKSDFKIWDFKWIKSLTKKEFDEGIDFIINKRMGEKLI